MIQQPLQSLQPPQKTLILGTLALGRQYKTFLFL